MSIANPCLKVTVYCYRTNKVPITQVGQILDSDGMDCDQYCVKVDGTGCLRLWNIFFLHKCALLQL